MISVILATKNRAAKLRQCLQAMDVASLRDLGGELVVVDNGSTDETPAVLEAFARDYPGLVKIVTEPGGGVSVARNSGIAVATKKVLCFFDDDIYPERDYFRTLAGLLDESFDLCSGRVLLSDPRAARTSISESSEPCEFSPRALLRAGRFHGCHLIVKRRVIEKIGAFDPRLGAGSVIPSGEDHDFVCRALNAGFRARYLPELCIYHDHGRTDNGPEMNRIDRGYSQGRGAVYLKRTLEGDLRYLALWIATIRPRAISRFADEARGAALFWSLRAAFGQA